jgi:transcription termination factor Rho
LTVDTFTFLPTSPATFTGAADVIKVGGTLTVGASQTAGVYSGSFSVAVAYN